MYTISLYETKRPVGWIGNGIRQDVEKKRGAAIRGSPSSRVENAGGVACEQGTDVSKKHVKGGRDWRMVARLAPTRPCTPVRARPQTGNASGRRPVLSDITCDLKGTRGGTWGKPPLFASPRIGSRQVNAFG